MQTSPPPPRPARYVIWEWPLNQESAIDYYRLFHLLRILWAEIIFFNIFDIKQDREW